MKVKIGDTTIYIRWKHNFLKRKIKEVICDTKEGIKVEERLVVVGQLKSNRYTDCIIEIAGGDDIVALAHARAMCAKGDDFCKCAGRKISLARAIEIMRTDETLPFLLDRAARLLIWKEFARTTNCSFTVSEVPRRGEKNSQPVM